MKALTSSQPPGVSPACHQTEMWASQWDATRLSEAVPEPPHRAIQTNQGPVSLCALQEHLRAPRWPCRAPSPAGTGPSSSSGRPATSTRTAPRVKTRASCAVSRWGCPTLPSPAHAYSPLPTSPQAHELGHLPSRSVLLASSQWGLPKAT